MAHRAQSRLVDYAPTFSAPMFNDEAVAEAELLRRKQEVWRCAKCGGGEFYYWTRPHQRTHSPVFRCKACLWQCTLTTGTAMNNRKLPWTHYLRVERMVRDGGLSARQMAEVVGTDYKSVWILMRKIQANGNKLLRVYPLDARGTV